MATKIVRSREEEDKMHLRFIELMKQVKPLPHDVDCINIVKKVKPAMEYNRLTLKNLGGKHEKPYRQKRYIAEKDSIMALEYYVKNKIPTQ